MATTRRTAASGSALLGRLAPRSAQVRERLEASIRRGDFRPGDRLPSERELMQIFGVSRVTVREAIRSLQAVSLVDVRHGHGCFVTDPARRRGDDPRWLKQRRDEALELLRVRGALDELAAREAATRADADAIAAIRAAHVAFERASGRADASVAELAELDVGFHIAVAEASASTVLTSLLRDLHRHGADASRALAFPSSDRSPRSPREHAAILAAIEAHDAAAAVAASAAHLARVRELVRTAMSGEASPA